MKRVISGGQTGVDQAALRAALAAGLEIGGFCPPGRECEDGVIPAEFPLRETPASSSPDAPHIPRSLRTQWNVRMADATFLLRGNAELDAGSAWTETCALHYAKPILILNLETRVAPSKIAEWIREHVRETLLVAGPSERTLPGVGERAYSLLSSLFLDYQA